MRFISTLCPALASLTLAEDVSSSSTLRAGGTQSTPCSTHTGLTDYTPKPMTMHLERLRHRITSIDPSLTVTSTIPSSGSFNGSHTNTSTSGHFPTGLWSNSSAASNHTGSRKSSATAQLTGAPNSTASASAIGKTKGGFGIRMAEVAPAAAGLALLGLAAYV